MQICCISVALGKKKINSSQIVEWCLWSREASHCTLGFWLAFGEGAGDGFAAAETVVLAWTGCVSGKGQGRQEVGSAGAVNVCLQKVNGVSCVNFHATNGLWESEVLMWPCHYAGLGGGGGFEVPTERSWPAHFHGNGHHLNIYNLWLKIQKGGENLLNVTNVKL